jgi:hypothetical protein
MPDDEVRYRVRATMEFELTSGDFIHSAINAVGKRIMDIFNGQNVLTPDTHINSIEITELAAERVPRVPPLSGA